jgi:thiol-disulfide isomerase/thioredoxin
LTGLLAGARRLAAVLAVVVVAVGCGGDGPGTTFTAVDPASGAPRSVDDVRGAPTLLAGWATWCVPCERELPALEAALADLTAAGVRVVAVNVDGPTADEADVAAMIERLAPSLEVWRDEGSSLLGAYDGFLMPFSVLLDADGEPIRTWAGSLDPDEVVPALTG